MLGRCGKFGGGGGVGLYGGSLVGPCADILSAVVSDPVIGLAYGRQQCTVCHFELVQGIAARYMCILVLVHDGGDPDGQDPITTIPALEDFVLNPLAVRGFRSNENYGDACVLQLVIDPTFDGSITLLFDGFPIRCVNEAILILACDDVAVSDLTRAPSVTFIVKAKEDFSSHKSPLPHCNLLVIC